MSMNGCTPGYEEYCPNGHLYSEANTLSRPDGGRRCLACKQAAVKRAARKRRAATRQRQEVRRDTTWMADGKCGGVSPESFAPITAEVVRAHGGNPADHPRIQRAIAFCHRSECPVRERCHAWGRATNQVGVWGGQYLSREALRKKGVAA